LEGAELTVKLGNFRLAGTVSGRPREVKPRGGNSRAIQLNGSVAIVLGEIVYSEPRTDIKLADITKLEGGVRAELRADISGRLLETASGASVWTRSAWTKRQLGSVSMSAGRGVSGSLGSANPRAEMVSPLVYHLTHDFRPSTVREER
jgi:hypothetical protein